MKMFSISRPSWAARPVERTQLPSEARAECQQQIDIGRHEGDELIYAGKVKGSADLTKVADPEDAYARELFGCIAGSKFVIEISRAAPCSASAMRS